MSEADIEVARRAAEWFTLDEPLCLDIFAEDHVWKPSLTGGDMSTGGTFVGVQGWEEYRREAHVTWASLAAEVRDLSDRGAGVVTGELVLRGVGQASHVTVEMPVHAVMEVRDGRLARTHVFQTAEEARRRAEDLLGDG